MDINKTNDAKDKELLRQQIVEYNATFPSMATAQTAALFKPMNIDRQAWIEEIYKGAPLFDVTSEMGVVQDFQPIVGNKLITQVQDFTKSVSLSKDLFDFIKLLLNNLLSSVTV